MAPVGSDDNREDLQASHVRVPSGQGLAESENSGKDTRLEIRSSDQTVHVQENIQVHQGQGHTTKGQGQGHIVVADERQNVTEIERPRIANPLTETPSSSHDPNYNPMVPAHNQASLTTQQTHLQTLARPIETPYPVGIPPTLGVPPGVDTAQIIHNVLTFQSQNFTNYQYQ